MGPCGFRLRRQCQISLGNIVWVHHPRRVHVVQIAARFCVHDTVKDHMGDMHALGAVFAGQ